MEEARQDLRSSPALRPRFHRATPTRGEKLCTNPLKLSSSPALQRQTRVDLTISLAHQQLTPLLRHHLLRRASIGLDPLSSADKRYLRHLQLFIGKDLSRITTDDVLIFAQAKRDGIAGRINAATQQRLLRSIQKAQLPLVDQDTLLAKHRAPTPRGGQNRPKTGNPYFTTGSSPISSQLPTQHAGGSSVDLARGSQGSPMSPISLHRISRGHHKTSTSRSLTRRKPPPPILGDWECTQCYM